MYSYNKLYKKWEPNIGREAYMRRRANYRKTAMKGRRAYSPYMSNPRYFRPGYDRTSGLYRSGGYGAEGRGGGELKFHDRVVSNVPIGAGGQIILPAYGDIIEDTTPTGRIGRKVTIRSIEWRWRISLPGEAKIASSESSDIVRLICFVDKQTNGTGPVVADLLLTAQVSGLYNLTNVNRFKILMDKNFNIQYTGITSETDDTVSFGQITKTGQWSKQCSIPIEYSGTTGDVAEVRSNGIGILLLTDQTRAGILGNFRVRYSD